MASGIKEVEKKTEKSESEEQVEEYKITDILLASFLLIQEGITIGDMLGNEKSKNEKVRSHKIFVLRNVSGKSFKYWILGYHNDEILVPPSKFTKKINDLRDLVNQRF